MLLDKGGAMLKPFLPQLQTTFVKALNDPSSEVQYYLALLLHLFFCLIVYMQVREYAAAALGKLMTMQTRVDPLVRLLLTHFITCNTYYLHQITVCFLQVTDLMAGISETSGGVREAMLQAMQKVKIRFFFLACCVLTHFYFLWRSCFPQETRLNPSFCLSWRRFSLISCSQMRVSWFPFN